MINRSTNLSIERASLHKQVAAINNTQRISAELPPFKLAEITNATAIAGTSYRWLYEWREIRIENTSLYEPFYDLDTLYNPTNNAGGNSQENTALNVNELGNTAGLVFPGYSPASLPAGVSILPVFGCVFMYQGYLGSGVTATSATHTKPIWLFAAINPVDGDCI